MAREHVEAVFGPQWVQDSLKWHKERLAGAEKIVLSLRKMLRERDPSLPDPYDGTAWWELEKSVES